MSEEQEMTEAQAQSMLRELAEQKQNQHTFFTKVIQTEDTTRVGNLNIEELGEPKIPLRSCKELALFCKEIWQQDEWADYFEKEAQDLTATSLSKDAILIKLSVTNKKELADVTPKEKKKNKGWFKKSS